MNVSFCDRCEEEHNWEKDEYLECVPPRKQLVFGPYHLDPEYKEALFQDHPHYCTEEVMGSYFGHNPYFPSQDEWLEEKDGGWGSDQDD